MNTRQMHMRRVSTFGDVDLFMRISMLFQQIVSFPAVSNNNRAWQNVFTHKWYQTITAYIGNALHSYSSKSHGIMHFYGNQNYGFPSCSPTTFAFLLFSSNKSFIDLYSAAQRCSSWPNHSSAHFVKPTPCCLVTLQTKDMLETQCTPTKFLACYIPNRLKPQAKRFSCPLEYSSGNEGHFMFANRTTEEPSVHPPCFSSIAYRTNKASGPTKFLQIFKTGLFCREPLVELLQCFRVINPANWMRVVIFHSPIITLGQ